MSEEPKNPEESSEINLEDYVPKEEHSKLLSEKDESITSLKNDLDSAKMQLLDQDYLDYLESKKKPSQSTKPKDSKSTGKVDEELQATIERLQDDLNKSNAALSDLAAENELRDVRARYNDFDDHKEDILKIIENSKTDLTFEQAYRLAKSYKSEKSAEGAEEGTKGKKTISATEKPSSTVPAKALETKEFKNQGEVDSATIESLKDKYPDWDGVSI